MRVLLESFLRDESGTVIEYVMIGILLTMVAISVLASRVPA